MGFGVLLMKTLKHIKRDIERLIKELEKEYDQLDLMGAFRKMVDSRSSYIHISYRDLPERDKAYDEWMRWNSYLDGVKRKMDILSAQIKILKQVSGKK
jgi:hypothetical protein